jgi:hypothetical protein
MSLIIYALQNKNLNPAKYDNHLLETALTHLTSAANKLDNLNKRQLPTNDLQATALDIRLTLELLQILNRPKQANKGAQI